MWWVILSVTAETFVDAPKIPLVIGGKTIQVEVADDPHERQLGLMHRKELDPDSGMIFVYEESRVRSFWMKNTHVPLTIGYIDSHCKLVHLADMIPLSTKGVSSIHQVQFALEMNQGWFERNGVAIGDSISGFAHCSSTTKTPK